jgi:L-lactate dehydrogenase complex protein LldG
MSSRDFILGKIKENQPTGNELPVDFEEATVYDDNVSAFKETLASIGGKAIEVDSYADIVSVLKEAFPNAKNIISNDPTLADYAKLDWMNLNPADLKDTDLCILKGQLGVAENAAIWLNETNMGQRAAPFINEYLSLIIEKENIVSNMHQAYETIGQQEYGFGAFIAGPSKTADIEQSLVLGAHGARGLHVFII